jgi:hypothetical protein
VTLHVLVGLDFKDIFERFVSIQDIVVTHESDSFWESFEDLQPLIKSLVRGFGSNISLLASDLTQVSNDAIDESGIHGLDSKLINFFPKKFHAYPIHEDCYADSIGECGENPILVKYYDKEVPRCQSYYKPIYIVR